MEETETIKNAIEAVEEALEGFTLEEQIYICTKAHNAAKE